MQPGYMTEDRIEWYSGARWAKDPEWDLNSGCPRSCHLSGSTPWPLHHGDPFIYRLFALATRKPSSAGEFVYDYFFAINQSLKKTYLLKKR